VSTVFIKRIVLPLDGSPLGEGALPVAIELASRLKVPIHLLRVIEFAYFLTPISPVGVRTNEYQETVSEIQAGVRTYLEGIVSRLQDQGVTADWTILEGSPFFAIGGTTQPDDLIVMTSHGRSGVMRWLLGSVAEKLVREAPAPVLLVPSPGREAEQTEAES
jgi:nucleotide-binding universal stress UspA family protein